MNVQQLMDAAKQAEMKLSALKVSSFEEKFTHFYFSFLTFIFFYIVLKLSLFLIGAIDTIASPLAIVICTTFAIVGGSIILIRHLARKKASTELAKIQASLLQFRNMKQTLLSSSGGAGGWSLYKKNTTVLTKAMIETNKKEVANEKSAENKAVETKKAEKTTPLRTEMRRGGMR